MSASQLSKAAWSWFVWEFQKYLNLDAREAEAAIRKNLAELPEFRPHVEGKYGTSEDAVSYRLTCIEQHFQSAHQRRSRVLDRTGVILTASSILLAAAVLFAQLPTAKPLDPPGDIPNGEVIPHFIFYGSLFLLVISITNALRILVVQLETTMVYEPDPAEVNNAHISLRRQKIARIAELQECIARNDLDTRIRTNKLDCASRQVKDGLSLFVCATLAYVAWEWYESIEGLLVPPLTALLLRPWSTAIAIGVIAVAIIGSVLWWKKMGNQGV